MAKKQKDLFVALNTNLDTFVVGPKRVACDAVKDWILDYSSEPEEQLRFLKEDITVFKIDTTKKVNVVLDYNVDVDILDRTPKPKQK